MIVTKGSNALTKILSKLHDITIACNQQHRYPAAIHAAMTRHSCGTPPTSTRAQDQIIRSGGKPYTATNTSPIPLFIAVRTIVLFK